MSPKRVCILRIGWQPFIDEPLKNLIGGLADRGIEVTFLKSRARPDLGLPEEMHPKATSRIFPLFFKRFSKVPVIRPLILFLGWCEFALRCAWMGYGVKPGMVIAIDVDVLAAGWLLAKICGAKLFFYSFELYTDRPNVPAKAFWDFLERVFIGRADLVAACESNRARVLQERYHLATCPITALNVPTRGEISERTDAIHRLLAEQGKPCGKVIYVHGWISHIRCADVFVRAMRQVREDALLFFVGPVEPSYKQELMALAQTCGVADRVVFQGVVPGDILLTLAASADIGLQIQRNVGLNSYYCAPGKLFQYFAVGLPVVASNFPGMVEVVEKNEVGLCVDPEDDAAVASAINRILDDDALRQRMSQNALRVAREKYCYEIEGKPLLDAVERELKSCRD